VDNTLLASPARGVLQFNSISLLCITRIAVGIILKGISYSAVGICNSRLIHGLVLILQIKYNLFIICILFFQLAI